MANTIRAFGATLLLASTIGTVGSLDTAAAHERHHGSRHVAEVAHRVARALHHTSGQGGAMSGIASVYSGEKTANGQYAYASGLTAAHKSLPFGTLVRVTNRSNGRSVVVRINDRGPYVGGRVIDLTPAGAHAIGSNGLAPVTLTVVGHA